MHSAIRIYGWDSRNATWHGPTELGRASAPNRKLLENLRSALGRSWFGPVNCRLVGGPCARFFDVIHDRGDCAVASVYCDESKTGPAEIVAVVPPARISDLRPDFAFEFLAFARFLGSVSPDAELKVHDAITEALAENRGGHALGFSISSGLWPADLDHLLSQCVEELALTLYEWIAATPRGAGRSS